MNINKLILIGASTGGPGQIHKIIRSLREDFDGAMVIAQHMEHTYISSFMDYLHNNAPLDVVQAKDGLTIENKKIYLLSQSTEIKTQLSSLYFLQNNGEFNYNPNIDLLLNSAMEISKKIHVMCIILTGIGNDGACGALNLYNSNAICIAEDEKSSIVYGMPKAAIELNPKMKQASIDEICEAINRF
ncbi:MAG: CheB methylesterase domain-containing protein [Sulfurospirillaceae bacterium]|nr:CheB methylesterase domain-containing protein [Sulfurospirillaceae bacterium]